MITYNQDLSSYNSFGIQANAKGFGTFDNIETLSELIGESTKPVFDEKPMILGGGSNILFTRNYNGLLLKNEIKGIELVNEDEANYYVEAGGGENWHQFVLHCINKNWSGLENLSLIPGNVGASPIQNIGAYGVELKDVFHRLQAFHLYDKTTVNFNGRDCDFGYRHSVFKTIYQPQFAITKVSFKLRKQPDFKTSYGAINEELAHMGVHELTIANISKAVINIRQSKLPDPAKIGNAGSFFKNPVITANEYDQLKNRFEKIPGFLLSDNAVKVPAAWLIEQCGWKGYRRGDAGVHALQALVLVNYKNASGNELLALSEEIIRSVFDKFNIRLEREVNII